MAEPVDKKELQYPIILFPINLSNVELVPVNYCEVEADFPSSSLQNSTNSFVRACEPSTVHLSTHTDAKPLISINEFNSIDDGMY